MSQLDALTGHDHSVSGVPMRQKKRAPEPTAADLVGLLANQLAATLAQSQRELTQELANALTSRPAVERRLVSNVAFRLTKNVAGQIDGGTVSNGEATWRVAIDRTGGGLSVAFTRI